MVPTVLLVCWCFCLLGPLGEMSQHRRLPAVKNWNKIKSHKLYNIIKLPFITYYQIFHYIRLVAFYRYSKSSIKPPLSNKPSVFRGGKLIRTPPPSLHPYSSQTIYVDWSVMVYSWGWKFIMSLVFGRMTSNFMYLIFWTLRSSYLWRLPQVNEILLTVTSTTHQSTLSPTRVFLLLVMRFAILNKPPLSFKPPPPLQKCLKNISPPGGLNGGFTVGVNTRSNSFILKPCLWQVKNIFNWRHGGHTLGVKLFPYVNDFFFSNTLA